MSSEAPAPTDLIASPVKPPSPSSTNAPIEAVELVEPLEPPTKVAHTAWWKSKPSAYQSKQHAAPILTTAVVSSRNTFATAIAPAATTLASALASGSALTSAPASAPASTSRVVVSHRPASNAAASLNGEAGTSAAAASVGTSNLPVADTLLSPRGRAGPQ